MIISHSRKFIFIKTIKTAGTSLEIALSKYCGGADVITPISGKDEALRRRIAGRGAQNYGHPVGRYAARDVLRRLALGKMPRRFDEHASAREIRREVGPEIWDSYFKFTVVRHPFDRAISRYFWQTAFIAEKGREDRMDFTDFDQFLHYRAGLINENWALYTEWDRVLVDHAVKYEELEAGLAEVSARIGLKHNLFEDMKSVRTKDTQRAPEARQDVFLTPSQRQLIALLCAKEMETFGYGSTSETGAAAAG